MDSLKERIRAEAARIGFPLCGFAPLDSPPHAEFVGQWLAEGNAATMSYLDAGLTKRLDPRLLLREARSVITVGYRYRAPAVPPVDWQGQLRGRIAAYALGDDYHNAMASKLEELAAYARGLTAGVVTRAYVDTGPVLEREWAASGGVGWFGKNTNILHREAGSWFFLGEILTNLEFDSDPPRADHCGTCTRCLDACPTQALQPGYRLDARLCISYLTIEHRGSIPTHLRPGMGNWIFGCDVCQEICPWNEKFVRDHGALESEDLCPSLPELLLLDRDAFRRRFRDSAIWRAKRDGFVRNVAVALGNTRNPEAVGVLAQALRHDPSALVRAHAAWALGAIADRGGQRALESARPLEPDEEVCREIDAAIGASQS